MLGIDMVTDIETTKAVKQVLRDMAQAYTKRDQKQLLNRLGKDVFLCGTGPDEVARDAGEAAKMAQRDWSQAESGVMEIKNINVHGEGPAAWCDADADLHVVAGGETIDMATRLTAVLVEDGQAWKIVQAHFSVPSAAQAEGQSWPTHELTSGQTMVH